MIHSICCQHGEHELFFCLGALSEYSCLISKVLRIGFLNGKFCI